jgi:hypothetical protein
VQIIRDAQQRLRRISPHKHGELVSALQAKVLALQGRGGDSEIAHVEPGEMVIPRSLLTRELVDFVHREAARTGIDPDRLMIGTGASINPATGAEEFGFRDWLKGIFGGAPAKTLEPDIEPINVSATRRTERFESPTVIDPIYVTAHKRSERLPAKAASVEDYIESAATGAAPFWSERLMRNAAIREMYKQQVERLDPFDNTGRSQIKDEWRKVTPQPFQDAINAARPSNKAREGSIGRANVVNKKATWLARAGGIGGIALGGLALQEAQDRIARAENKSRERFGVYGGMIGGYIGGGAGGMLGGGIASIPAAVVGSVGGSAAGERLGYGIYDGYNRFLNNLYQFGN